jgi:hypothetical protein
MAPQYQYAWTGSSQDEEPDLDALLAMSGGPKSNASSNPFGFEKLSGGGAAPRARREFEEADFYNPTFTNRR